MRMAVKSSLDVVFWFYDRALDDNEYLQPAKVHRLLYLAQAYWAVAYPGQKLMPATFVTDNFGPIEPTIFHAFSFGRPRTIEPNPIADQVTHFLDSIWRRFGQYTADQLTKKVMEHTPVAQAMGKGTYEEIPYEAMAKFVASEAAARKNVPAVENVVRPRVLRSQTGKPVAVTAWKPKAAGDKKE